MALVSPGVEVTIVDESFYVPGLTATVPLVVIATGQNKSSGAGTGTAAGTTAATAGDVYLISSQRELTNTFGNPRFYQSSNGSALNGYELNEYGLLAAYSVLGVTNRCYVVRADIDLSELTGTTGRPTGNPTTGTYWLDTSSASLWGIFEWNKSTGSFTNKIPTVITEATDLSGGIPKTSIGAIGDYAVVATNVKNPLYYKNNSNAWVLVGSQSWQISVPTIQGTTTSPTFSAAETVVINGVTVTLSSTTLASLVSDINTAGIPGVTAAAVNNKLELYADTDADSDGDSSLIDQGILIAEGTGTPFADAGVTVGTFYAPKLNQTAHTSVPAWKSTDTTPRPTGSVWIKTTTPNTGADLTVYVYSSTTETFSSVDAPLYANGYAANADLDASGGGENIAIGTLFTQYDVDEDDTATYKIFRRYSSGDLEVTGTETSAVITASDTFTLQESAVGSTSLSSAVTVTTSGTDLASLASDINGAGLTYVSASITASGALQIRHSAGGVIVAKDTSGTPLADAGITSSVTTGQVRAGNNSDLILSNWVAPTYTASTTAPSQNPTDLTHWYDSSTSVDVMVHNGTIWKGYQNESNDARGFDLSATDPNGVIVAAAKPTTQSDDTALVVGDLWLDSGDLENYPTLYRYETVNSENKWVLVDNTDQTTEDGIVFADARFMGNTTTDVVTGTVPTTKSLLVSDVVDIDRPDPTLYPRGTLLFNTRRSGGTVKQFRSDYFSRTNFASTTLYPTLPTEKDAWVTVSGNKNDGSPYMMRKAQRQVIVAAMKSAMDSSTALREEQRAFTLMATPGYPELVPNMVTLNNDRDNTAFIIGDTPFRLSTSGTALQNWATNANNAGVTGEDGLLTNDTYLGVFYPSGLTNDLAGNTVAVPPSHMMLRTFVRSDDKSYPWFAPAGTQRGQIDNANGLGYVSSTSGEFISTNVGKGTRDTLYQNAINPLTFINGTGLVNYGNKTRHNTTSALDRINVARLVAYLRNEVDNISKPFVFEPNDRITRNEIKQEMEKLCNDLIAKRGIYDYLVVCDTTNNTPTRIDRNELYVDIAIEPVKAAEFIYVPIRLKNTGEIGSGNIASANG